MRSFERVLTRLVGSSFVLSGVAAIAKARPLDAAQIATITLVGTMAGSAGVLATYLEWPQRPDEEYYNTVMFNSAKSTGRVRFSFFVSLVAVLVFAELPPADMTSQMAVLICGAISIYFFFRGMVTAGLAARQLESQQQAWSRLGADGRTEWIEFRTNQVRLKAERDASFEKASRELNELGDNIRLSARNINQTLKRARWEQRWRASKSFWDATGGRVYQASIEWRRQIAGDKLLTLNERTQYELSNLRARRMLDQLDSEMRADMYARIRAGKIRASRDEASGVEIFKDGVLRYLVVHEPLDGACARALLERLGSLRGEDRRFSNLILLTDNPEAPTLQASEIFAAEGIQVAEIRETSAGKTSSPET